MIGVFVFNFILMNLPIFYLNNLTAADVVTLNEDTSKHVVQVLRMKAGENLLLTDGKGSLFTVQIMDEHKKKCTVKMLNKKVVDPAKQKVSVAISLVKNATRFEWFLEKVTEIGATEIIPIICDRTEKQHFRHERMQHIVVSAMLQSKQAWLPVLRQPTPLPTVLKNSLYDVKLIAHCENEVKNPISAYRKQSSVQVLIGPEGDFTPNEISQSLRSEYVPVSLGDTRLRTETAGIVAVAALCV